MGKICWFMRGHGFVVHLSKSDLIFKNHLYQGVRQETTIWDPRVVGSNPSEV